MQTNFARISLPRWRPPNAARALLFSALCGAARLALGQDFYENGPVELQVYQPGGPGGNETFLTITRRSGFQPAEHLGTALSLMMQGRTGSTAPNAAAKISVQFGDRTAQVTASGTLPHDVPADAIAGAYQLKTPEERLAAAKERAEKLDAELNRVYGALKPKLGAQRMSDLRDLQREWIRFAYESGDDSAAAKAGADYWQTRADRAAERIQFLSAYTANSPTANEQELHAQIQAAEEAEAWPAVAEIARRILAGAPHDSAMWEKRARAFARNEDWPRCATALDEWEKAVTPPPPVIDALRGDVAWAAEKTEEAVHRWAFYLKSAPKETEVRDKLALGLDQLADYAGAVAVLEQRLKIEPAAAEYEHLAIDYALLRDWKKMSAAARRGSQIDATDEKAKATLPRVERLEKALPDIKRLDRAAAMDPKDPNPALERGLLYARLGWPELGLQEATSALKIEPASRRALLQEAWALLALARKEEADALEDVMAQNVSAWLDPVKTATLLRDLGEADSALNKNGPSAEMLARRAVLLNRAHQYQLAEKDAAAALNLDGKSDAALTAHAEALAETGREWNALPELARATEINPRNTYAWFLRGKIESGLSHFGAATEALSRALDLQPTLRAARELREKNYRAQAKTDLADSDARILNLSKQ